MISLTENLIDEPVLPKCRISVGIPARDEAEYLQKTLEAFVRQINLNGQPFDKTKFEIIVLINNSTDNSLKIARKFKAENQQLNLHIAQTNTSKKNANGGFIRRLLLDEVYSRLTQNGKKGGVMMTTDGDTQVADDWIAANMSEIENGADAVGGRINFSAEELEKMDFPARKFYLIDEEYRLLIAELEHYLDFLSHDPFPRHHQHFNGSFAVKTEIYKKAGGVPQVSCMEDVAFYNALLRIDAKIRHSPLVNVYTSARNSGRTEIGLSTQINDWINLAKRGEDFMVESAETVEKRIKMRNALRRIWLKEQGKSSVKTAEPEKFAAGLFVSAEYLFDQLRKQKSFGAFLEHIYQKQGEQSNRQRENSLVPIGEAVRDLRKKLEKLRRRGKTKSAAN